jgi:hypothetical protein
MHTGIHSSAHVPPTAVPIAFNCRYTRRRRGRTLRQPVPEGGWGAGSRGQRPGGSRSRQDPPAVTPSWEVLVERGVSSRRMHGRPGLVSAGYVAPGDDRSHPGNGDVAGYRAALVDATDGSVTAWPRFARIVRAAACGLTRRGLAEGDTAGVLVQDAASAAIAVNAIRGRGRPRLPHPTRTRARGHRRPAQRLRRAAADHLGSAGRTRRRGADRSRVRQVIAFGEATAPPRSARCSIPLMSSGWQPGGKRPEPGCQSPSHRSGAGGRTDRSRACPAGDGDRAPGDLTHGTSWSPAPPCGDGPGLHLAARPDPAGRRHAGGGAGPAGDGRDAGLPGHRRDRPARHQVPGLGRRPAGLPGRLTARTRSLSSRGCGAGAGAALIRRVLIMVTMTSRLPTSRSAAKPNAVACHG